MNYVCSNWLNAHTAYTPNVLPTECGWVRQDGCYRLKWYDGKATPTTVYNYPIANNRISRFIQSR